MSVSYEIDTSDRLVRVLALGSFSAAEIGECLGALTEEPEFEPNYSRLWDFRRVGGPISTHQVRDVVYIVRGFAGFLQNGLAAIVVSSDFHYGMARMFSILTSDLGIDTEVFRGIAEAREWIASPYCP